MNDTVIWPVEPKPCPACGSEPEIGGYAEFRGPWCPNYHCIMVPIYRGPGLSENIADWNRRVAPADDQVVDDLSMLVRRLVRALKKASPNSDLPAQSMDYLRRKGLAGNVLRSAPADDELARLERELAMHFVRAWLVHNAGDEWGRIIAKWPKHQIERYLELRGLLERHPDDPTLVRVREES